MPLTNKQYDTIMREYDRRQYQDYRLQCTRIDQIYEQIPQLLRLHFGQFLCRVGQGNLQSPQTVQGQNIPLCLPGQPPGYIALRMGGHLYTAVFRPNIHGHKGRLRKGLADLLRRLIVRKHIQ